jgi:hypothetical protein
MSKTKRPPVEAPTIEEQAYEELERIQAMIDAGHRFFDTNYNELTEAADVVSAALQGRLLRPPTSNGSGGAPP